MSTFSERLRAEIEFSNLSQKEFAAKAGIKRRALDMYLGVQQSMPPADVAVKIASTLGVSVEYLITGKELRETANISKYVKYRDFLDDVSALPNDFYTALKAMVRVIAGHEREKKR
jgi:transcriptional regulator with XRE-family HTH domain